LTLEVWRSSTPRLHLKLFLKSLTKAKKFTHLQNKHSQYCSGVGKGMHMMQYSRSDTYNAGCDLARHMARATQVHYDTMLRMMKYVDDTSERGLVLNLMQKWNRNKEHGFIISGQSDSNYVKDSQTQKNISGYRVL
jgi:hypothetical protein